MTGMKVGRLTVIKQVESRNKTARWLCKCDCGNECVVSRSSLKNERTQSCGCYRDEVRAKLGKNLIQYQKNPRTHGLSHTRIYKIWDSMKGRCKYKRPEYKRYAENNIKVCDEWQEKFMSFYEWAMENGYEDGLTLDRIDNSKGYCPNNCRWVTMKEQENNRTNNHLVKINGITKTIAEWSEISGLAYGTIRNRVYKGWIEDDILKPARKKRKV